MANFSKAFSVGDGISFDEIVGILAGADDPTITPVAAPVGSLYLRAGTTQVYIKSNTGDTDWTPLSGSGGITPRQVMSYTALRT